MRTRDQLNAYIEQLERRLRLCALLRGGAILTSVALTVTVVLVLIANALAFSTWSLDHCARGADYGAGLCGGLWPGRASVRP